jgi:hypothetical protein
MRAGGKREEEKTGKIREAKGRGARKYINGAIRWRWNEEKGSR